MIPLTLLLPPIPAKDSAEFEALSRDFDSARIRASSFNREARVARKQALRAKLKTAPANQLLAIGAELETLDASFELARGSAKAQLKGLGGRYQALFPRLLDACQSRANELASEIANDWEKHFAAFEAQPTGESPLLAYVLQWKKQLADKRAYIESLASLHLTPVSPVSILPYYTSRPQK